MSRHEPYLPDLAPGDTVLVFTRYAPEGEPCFCEATVERVCGVDGVGDFFAALGAEDKRGQDDGEDPYRDCRVTDTETGTLRPMTDAEKDAARAEAARKRWIWYTMPGRARALIVLEPGTVKLPSDGQRRA